MPDNEPVQRTPFPAEAERERTGNKRLTDRPEFEGRPHIDPFDRDANARPADQPQFDATGQPRPEASARTEPAERMRSQVAGTSELASGTTGTAQIAGGGMASEGSAAPDVPLLSESEASRLREQWTEYQAHFVDAPKEAVQSADELVAEVMQRVAKEFAERRSSLESRWARGEDVTTEDLRVALQGYREFFNRLLAA